MARKKWNFDLGATYGNADVRHELKPPSKKWDFDTLVSGGNEDARHLLKTRPYWQQLEDSLTEHDRKQLLDDLDGWDEATWEHRQHPPKPRHPSEGRIGNGP